MVGTAAGVSAAVVVGASEGDVSALGVASPGELAAAEVSLVETAAGVSEAPVTGASAVEVSFVEVSVGLAVEIGVSVAVELAL